MADNDLSHRIVVCQWCGASFEARPRGHNVFCSYDCRRLKRLSVLKAGRARAGSQVGGETANCLNCGEAYVAPHGLNKWCPICAGARRKEISRQYRERNLEQLKESSRQRNRRRSGDPEYQAKRRVWAATLTAIRRREPRHKLDHRMGQLIRNSLSGGKGGRTWESLVGYSIVDLMAHLERQFLRGMSWDNIEKWHVDHILPKSMFEYQSPDDDDFAACWALTNLRPLWSGENIKKGNKRLFLI